MRLVEELKFDESRTTLLTWLRLVYVALFFLARSVVKGYVTETVYIICPSLYAL